MLTYTCICHHTNETLYMLPYYHIIVYTKLNNKKQCIRRDIENTCIHLINNNEVSTPQQYKRSVNATPLTTRCIHHTNEQTRVFHNDGTYTYALQRQNNTCSRHTTKHILVDSAIMTNHYICRNTNKNTGIRRTNTTYVYTQQ